MRTRTWIGLSIVGTIILFIVFLYGVEWVAEDRVESYLSGQLSDSFSMKSIDVDFFPARIRLNNPVIESGEEPLASARTISARPRFSSLFQKTLRIENIVVEDVELTIRKASGGYSISHTLDELFAGTGGQDGGTTPLVIERLAVLNGRLKWYRSEDRQEPDVNLHPLHAVVQPMDFTRRQTEFNLTFAIQPDRDRPPLRVDGLLKPYDPANYFDGALTAQQFRLQQVSPFTPGFVRIETGDLSGTVPFTIHSAGLRTGPTQLNLDNLTVNVGEKELSTTDRSEQNGSDPMTGLKLGRTEIRTANTTIRFGAGEDRIEMQSSEGFLDVEQRPDPDYRFEFKGGFQFTRPVGELLYDLRVEPSPPYQTSVLAELTSSKLNGWNSILLRGAPIEMTRGSGVGAVDGTVSTDSLDLQVGFDLSRLKIQTRPGGSSGFLGMSTPMLARYLSKDDGNLELSFRVRGTPSEPTVDVSAIRQRLVSNLGVDAAVLGTLGLPVFVGDRALQRVTGMSVVGGVRTQLGKLFETDDPFRHRRERTKGTSIPSPEQRRTR